MKKHTLLMAFATVILAFAANSANARTYKKLNTTSNNISVRHLESDDQYIYVQVNLLQNEEKPATLRVIDEYGSLLYTDRIKTRSHVVTLKFRPEDLEKLSIELATSEGLYVKRFAVEMTSTTSTGIKEINKK